MRSAGLPVEIRYLPLDSPILLRRFIRRNQPRTLVLVETELWPNLLRQARLAGLHAVLVNGRLSPRLRRTYHRLSQLYAPLLARLEWIGAQDAADADHFRELGASRVEVTGNLKFDLPDSPATPALERNRFAGDRLWLAGSTHPGEEAPLLSVHRGLQEAHPDGRVQMLLAPRHPARTPEVMALCRESGFNVVARSSIDASATAADVIVLDTLGELVGFYAIADAAFVGGSLVPRGGQNPLEAIVADCPVVMGPDSRNFAGMVERLRSAGAIAQVADTDALLGALRQLLEDPEAGRAQAARARQVLRANSGATLRTLCLLEPLLPGPDRSSGHANPDSPGVHSR